MLNLFCILREIKKNIFFIFLLLITESYAVDDLNYNNFTLTSNELITEAVVGNIGVSLANISFWFISGFLIKKLIVVVRNQNRSEYEYIGDEDRVDSNKLILINSILLHLAEISLLENYYTIFPNNYILLSIRVLSFLGLIKFSTTKNKTIQEIFNRIISLVLLENIVTAIPNSLSIYYKSKYPIESKSIMNAAGVAVSTTSSLLASTYIYDLAYKKTNNLVTSLTFFILSDLIIGVISSIIAAAIIEYNVSDLNKKYIWGYQMLGYSIFTIINSVSALAILPNIKGYGPYLYSCLLSASGFGIMLFILNLSEKELLKNDFFWQDTSSDVLGVLSFISIAAASVSVPLLSSILTYNYGEKIIKKLHKTKKRWPLIILGTITPLCISLVNSGVMSFCYNAPLKKTLPYLNQLVLTKFYNIIQYTKILLKI
jgi:hypothetical protein